MEEPIPVFVVLMLVGLGGLVLMVLPGLSGRGGGRLGRMGRVARGPHGVKRMSDALLAGVRPSAVAPRGRPTAVRRGAASVKRAGSVVLDPRLLFSLVALYGASGQVAVQAGLSEEWSALLAIPAAIGLEWGIVGRLWRFAMRFESLPATPMKNLQGKEVEAVTPFRNGKGVVCAVRDGRTVQLLAKLEPTQIEETVRTGDRLLILEVEPNGERVTVIRA
jgi:hypothetical protein